MKIKRHICGAPVEHLPEKSIYYCPSCKRDIPYRDESAEVRKEEINVPGAVDKE